MNFVKMYQLFVSQQLILDKKTLLDMCSLKSAKLLSKVFFKTAKVKSLINLKNLLQLFSQFHRVNLLISRTETSKSSFQFIG